MLSEQDLCLAEPTFSFFSQIRFLSILNTALVFQMLGKPLLAVKTASSLGEGQPRNRLRSRRPLFLNVKSCVKLEKSAYLIPL